MLFNSYIFLFVLLPLSLAGYYLLNHFRHDQVAKCWLVAASLFFYAYFNPWYLLILGGSIVLNFLFGRLILSQPQESAGRCAAAVVAILLNLGVLFCFKYYDFFRFQFECVVCRRLAPAASRAAARHQFFYLPASILYCGLPSRDSATLSVLGLRTICQLFPTIGSWSDRIA